MRWLYGNTEVVAPISAPMLQMVAIPVHVKTHTSLNQRGNKHLIMGNTLILFILTGTGYGVNSWTVVFYNGSSAALHCQDASHLQDNILGRRPA